MNNNSEFYYANFHELVSNRGIVGVMAKMNHISLEHRFFVGRRELRQGMKIIEVGAGQGQHVKYVEDNYDSYLLTDLRPTLLKPLNRRNNKIQIEDKSIDAESLPYGDNEFDRLIATCLLIHLTNPEKALFEWKRVVKPGGEINIYIPCESGFVLRLAQFLTTRRKQKKLGLDAKYFHYQEHRYSYPFLISLLKNVFGNNLRIRKFPFFAGPFDINLWAVATIRNSK
jgi:ubiquinone/menaquinone biosynthesis C-methylase UbiE